MNKPESFNTYMIRHLLQVFLVFLVMMAGTVAAKTARKPLCDLVITHVNWTPETPVEGDMITFTATIKNIGSAATPAGVIHGVVWRVNNGTVNWSDHHTLSLEPGESVTLKTSGGEGYYAIHGIHALDVFVDPVWDINRIDESDKTNNSFSTELAVGKKDNGYDTHATALPLMNPAEIQLTCADIGGFANTPGEMGNTVAVEAGTAYTITSRGHEIALHSPCDWHHFAYLALDGDFDVQVRVDNITAPYTNYDASGALVARESLDGSARILDLKALVPGSLHGNGNFSGRKVVGGNLFAGEDKLFSGGGAIMTKGNPVWLRIQRVENRFLGYHSHDGSEWTSLNAIYADMPQVMYVGLAASPFGFEIPVTVRFSNMIIYGNKAKEPTPAVSKGTGMGLSADYFNGKNFETYLFSRTDSVVDFNFEYGDPVDIRMGYENYSIQWTGFLEPKKSGKHTIYVVADDGVRVWINNQLRIDGWKDQAATGYGFDIELQQGEKYPIRIDYFDGKIGGKVRLLWQSETMPLARIPASQLHPDKDNLIAYAPKKQTERITSLTEAESTKITGAARTIYSPFASAEKAVEIPPVSESGLRWENIDGGVGGIHYLNIVYNTPEKSWLDCTKDIYVNNQLIDQYHFFPEGTKSYHLKIELNPGSHNTIAIKHGERSAGSLFVDFLGIDSKHPVLPLLPSIPQP